MSQSVAIERTSPSAKSSVSEAGLALATFLITLLFIAVALYLQKPPAPQGTNSPPEEFSAARAFQHVQAIAQRPHPIGTSDHSQVQTYIRDSLKSIGLDSELQQATVNSPRANGPYIAATVKNIISTLEGSEGEGVILMVAHYDSLPNSPGANDNGTGVATLLETARALKAGAPIKRDVVFLFSDGEEFGLLGAKAFVKDHPLAKQVQLVLNFEARGQGGPSIMFQSSPNNAKLIAAFASEAPHPFASSLYPEVYKYMPNDTDATVFINSGVPTLNLAYLNGISHYHSANDRINSVDLGSLQHHGSYALSLSRELGKSELQLSAQSDAIYFNLAGSILIHYSDGWALPLAILSVLCFIAVVLVGLKRGTIQVSGAALGFLSSVLGLIASTGVAWLIWWVLGKTGSVKGWLPQGDSYHSIFYFVAFVLLAIAVTSSLYSFCSKRISPTNLAAGALLLWALLAITSSIVKPSVSFLFTWPLLFSLVGFLIWIMKTDSERLQWKPYIALVLSSIPALLMTVPLIYQLYVGLTISNVLPAITLAALVMGLLVPQLSLMTRPKRWLLPGAFALAGLLALTLVSFRSDFDQQNPKPGNVLYGMSGDSGRATWATSDESIDEWSTQFFGETSEKNTLPDFFPFISTAFTVTPAGQAQVGTPELEVLEERVENDVRTVRLRIISSRRAPVMSVLVHPDSEVFGAYINQERVDADAALRSEMRNRWTLIYYGLPENGFELTLQVPPSPALKIRLVDRSFELPQLPGRTITARPDSVIPSTGPFSDSTFISKSFRF